LVEIGDEVYIFWHRQTHGTGFSRQGCADRVQIAKDGTIAQIAITSCGLNRGPLPAKHAYQTYIACHLTEKDRAKVGHVVEPGPGEGLPTLPEEMPYITEEECESADHGLKPYIANLREGAVAGFKYLAFDGTESVILLTLRGQGALDIRLDDPEGGSIVASADNKNSGDGWTEITTDFTKTTGTHALYFTVKEGRLDFADFEIK
jgi:hypothetical protein